jgi:RHS repeat-associated protein
MAFLTWDGRATWEKAGKVSPTRAPHQFSTKYTDEETGLCYYGYRYYGPSRGGWLNRDPVEEGGGADLTAFVLNNPIRHTDRLGLSIENIKEDSLGVRPPGPIWAGQTWPSQWTTLAWVDPGVNPRPGSCFRVKTRGHATVSYWWSDRDSFNHEMVHVDITELHWGAIQQHAAQVEGLGCMCYDKAQCYADAATLFFQYITWRSEYQNRDFDCRTYGGTCEEARVAKSNTAEALRQYNEKTKKCKSL